MKNMRMVGTACVALALLAVAGWAGSGAGAKGVTVVGSISWANSIEDAKARAMREGKPVLHLQMFGNLGDEFC